MLRDGEKRIFWGVEMDVIKRVRDIFPGHGFFLWPEG